MLYQGGLGPGAHDEICVKLLAKVLCQWENVFPPLPKGRNVERNDVEPVIQIPTEATLLHHTEEILIGGRENADIHRNRINGADADDLPFFQYPEKLGLQGGTHGFNLVQKQSSLMGTLKQTWFSAFLSAGEGAFHITKEFTFQQCFC